jgi:hypothetical protein
LKEKKSVDANRNRITSTLGAAVIVVFGTVWIGGLPEASAQEKAMKSITVENSRNLRFGELLVIKDKSIDIYNTTGLNECPAELWDAMDLEMIKKQFGAKAIQKNGPHYWMMDTLTVSVGEKASFGGIEARWGATIDPRLIGKSDKGSEPYKVFNPKKTQKMVYSKGKPVYELVDPEGHIYVLQAREEKFPMEMLPKLGDQMKKVPKGWQYRTRILTEDLVLDLGPDNTIYGVGDEFHQYYTRIPESK